MEFWGARILSKHTRGRLARNVVTKAEGLVEKIQVDHLVIGAGVVGLAIARELSQRSKTESVLLVEKNRRFGMETSSRNSEVIHAGIYYPENSLKTQLCIEGNRMLYEYCRKMEIPHRKIGKWIVAASGSNSERAYLEKIHKKSQRIGVETELINIKSLRNNKAKGVGEGLLGGCLKADSILNSPTTGILDSHRYMEALKYDFEERNGGLYSPNTKVVDIERMPGGMGKGGGSGYRALVKTNDQENPYLEIETGTVINSAGLWADTVHNLCLERLGLYKSSNVIKYRFAKGKYYLYQPSHSSQKYDKKNSYKSKILAINKLIYPVPDENLSGLGVHLTLDLGNQIKFGPDVEYVESNTDYSVKQGQDIDQVVCQIQKYLPGVNKEDLVIGYSGIRPKLSGKGEPARDFLIVDGKEKGMSGVISLLGIESPGLTSSLAIAKRVLKSIF